MMKNRLNYDFFETKNGIFYTIDMIHIRVDISEKSLEQLNRGWCMDETNKLVKEYPECYTSMKWRYFYKCEYGNRRVLKMGFCQNDAKSEYRNAGFIEFNPNSFADHKEFWEEYPKLMAHFRFPEITRFDLAIDMPYQRNEVALIKDQRKYECQRISALNQTEYLGRRNKVSRVKLYNKQMESHLTFPLTRLEVTCDLAHVNIPKVVDLRNLPKSDSQLLTIVLRSQNFTQAVADLSLYQRSRLLNLIDSNIIEFDQECIQGVVDYARKLVKVS